MNWVAELNGLIHARWKIGDSFTLAQIYEFEANLGRTHPENHHIRDKIRQGLQALRDDGYIWFVDGSGHYKLLR